MSNERTKQELSDWLIEQPGTAPPRLLWSVLSGVDQTPQRGRWRATIGRLPMFSPNAMRLYGVAAVAALVVVLGFTLWGRNMPSVGPAVPTSTPLVTPAPTIAPATAVPTPAAKTLTWVPWQLSPPGFFVPATIQSLDLSSPGRWSRTQEGTTMAVVFNDTGPTYDTFNVASGAEPYVDPCAGFGEFETVAVGPSVDDLITAMTKIPVDVSSVMDTEVAGYPAKSLTFVAPAPKPGCDDGEFQLWQWPDPFAQPAPVGPTGKTTVYVVDVNGTRVIVTLEDRGTPEDSALLQHMLDTLVLGSGATN